MVEVLNQLKKIDKRYQTPFGIAIWGYTAPGDAQEILVDSDGHLQVDGLTTGNPPNLDIAISALRNQLLGGYGTLEGIDDVYEKLNAQLDITVSALRDAIRGAATKDFSTLESDVESLDAKFPSAAALSDSLGNPTTTLIGAALLGWDAAALVWERIKTDGAGRLEIGSVTSVGDIAKWGGTTVTGRDISGDLQALTDDTIKGLMRSIGDAGAAPTNQTGETILKKLHDIETFLDELTDALGSVATDTLRVVSV